MDEIGLNLRPKIIQWVEEKFGTQYDKKEKIYRLAQTLIFKKYQGTKLTSADEEILAEKYLIQYFPQSIWFFF